MPREVPLVLPDLELPGRAVLTAWLAQAGDGVVEGDRLVEILAGEVLLELAAPATGLLLQQHVAVDEPLLPGQVLGVIRER